MPTQAAGIPLGLKPSLADQTQQEDVIIQVSTSLLLSCESSLNPVF